MLVRRARSISFTIAGSLAVILALSAGVGEQTNP